MQKHKRLLIIIPMIFTICLSLAIPFSSFAITYVTDTKSHDVIYGTDENPNGIFQNAGYNPDYYYAYTLERCKNEADKYTADKYYFYIQGSTSKDKGSSYTYSRYETYLITYFFVLSSDAYVETTDEYVDIHATSIDEYGGLSYWFSFDANGSVGSSPYLPDHKFTYLGTYTKNPYIRYYYETQYVDIKNDDYWLAEFKLDINAVDCDVTALEPKLDVEVTFRPNLSGAVDRTVTDQDGNEGLGQVFSMHIKNNSRFAIQYTLSIYEHGADFLDSSGTTAKFIYYSYEWVYARNIDNESNFMNDVPQLQNKGSEQHRLDSQSSETVIIHYNQVNLVEGVHYDVIVTAYPCPYDYASQLFYSPSYDDKLYKDLYQIDSTAKVIAYQSEFWFLQYNDVVYDPESSANGVLPFSGGQDPVNKYGFSYNATKDSNGNVNYNGVDLYSSPDSWWGQQRSSFLNSGYVNSRSSANVETLQDSFTDYFSFMNTVLNYFPSQYMRIITLGLTSIVVLAIIKVVLR